MPLKHNTMAKLQEKWTESLPSC